jgi:hypothetical protein
VPLFFDVSVSSSLGKRRSIFHYQKRNASACRDENRSLTNLIHDLESPSGEYDATRALYFVPPN